MTRIFMTTEIVLVVESHMNNHPCPCGKELGHGACRELDAAIAKLKGFKYIFDSYKGKCNEIPAYSSDERVAFKELWQDDWWLLKDDKLWSLHWLEMDEGTNYLKASTPALAIAIAFYLIMEEKE